MDLGTPGTRIRMASIGGSPRSGLAGALILFALLVVVVFVLALAIPLVLILAVLGAIAIGVMRLWALVLALLHRDGAGRRNVRVVKRDGQGL
jgi:hypothetical protein